MEGKGAHLFLEAQERRVPQRTGTSTPRILLSPSCFWVASADGGLRNLGWDQEEKEEEEEEQQQEEHEEEQK